MIGMSEKRSMEANYSRRARATKPEHTPGGTGIAASEAPHAQAHAAARRDRRAARTWSRTAFMGGMLQVVAVAALLVTPTPISCLWGQAPCEPHGFIPFANSTSYILLGLVAIAGLSVVSTGRTNNLASACVIRWIGSLISIYVTFLSLFGVGLLLLPGSLFMLASALSCTYQLVKSG